MNTPFLYIISGASGSGKTNLLINLFKKRRAGSKQLQSYSKCFDHIIIVSPSRHTLDEDIFLDLADDKKYDIFDENVINKVDALTNSRKYKDGDENLCLILDDVSSQLRDGIILKDFIRLSTNRRHLNLSIIIICHNIMQIDPKIRNNASLIFIFKPKNLKEEKNIRENYFPFEKKIVDQLFEYVYRDRYSFLLLDTSLRDTSNFEYYKNFNKLTIE